MGKAVVADKIAGAWIEAGIAISAIAVPFRRPGRWPIRRRTIIGRRRNHVDLAWRERAADNCSDTQAYQPSAQGITSLGRRRGYGRRNQRHSHDGFGRIGHCYPECQWPQELE